MNWDNLTVRALAPRVWGASGKACTARRKRKKTEAEFSFRNPAKYATAECLFESHLLLRRRRWYDRSTMTTANTARKGPRPSLIASRPPRKREPRLLAIIDQNRCTGCEACIAFCPVDCIEIVPGADFAQFQQTVEVDIERCIGCALCAKHCPWDAIPMFSYREGIEKAPLMTLKSICEQKTRGDLEIVKEAPASGPAS